METTTLIEEAKSLIKHHRRHRTGEQDWCCAAEAVATAYLDALACFAHDRDHETCNCEKALDTAVPRKGDAR